LLVRDGPDVRKRVIASDSCADLAGAAAINVALLLGVDVSGLESQSSNDAVDQQAPQQGAAEGNTRRSDATHSDAHKTQAKERDTRREHAEQTRAESKSAAASSGTSSTRRWNALLRAPVLVAELGPLPGAVLGVALGGGVRYESWRLLLSGQLFREQTIDAAEVAAGADVQRMAGQLEACRGWRFVRFEIAPCLGLGVEYLSARGFGDGVSPETRRSVWAALSVGTVAHWYALDYMAVFVGMSGYLELSRPRLVIEGIGEIQQLAPAAAGIALGVEWIL
jgi:hypothetical protein